MFVQGVVEGMYPHTNIHIYIYIYMYIYTPGAPVQVAREGRSCITGKRRNGKQRR
jgi:hypothetical protein